MKDGLLVSGLGHETERGAVYKLLGTFGLLHIESGIQSENEDLKGLKD